MPSRGRLPAGAGSGSARGVYLTEPRPATSRQRPRALQLSTGGVPSHMTAARVHRLWDVTPGEWVTVPPTVHRRGRPGLRVHRAELSSCDIVSLGELTVTSVERTCADLCRWTSEFQSLAALDSAVRLGRLTSEALRRLAAVDHRRTRRLAGLTDGRSESALETGWRLAFADVGIRLQPQVEVEIEGRRFRLDLADESARVGLECDGREVHGAPVAVYADRRRANLLVAAGWRLFRATWRDLYGDRRLIVEPVRAALSA